MKLNNTQVYKLLILAEERKTEQLYALCAKALKHFTPKFIDALYIPNTMKPNKRRNCMKKVFILAIALMFLAVSCALYSMRESRKPVSVVEKHEVDEELTFEVDEGSKLVFNPNPTYICKKHGEIWETTYFYVNNEEYHFCTLDFIEVLISHFDEVTLKEDE